MNLVSLIILILILGIIIFVHELGHFLAAKKSGVYVEEFALGMGPKIFSFKRKKDETLYSIRLFPIGGFVSMANSEEDSSTKLRKDQVLENKSFFQKLTVLIIGIIFNLILALLLLFINGLIYGNLDTRPFIGGIEEDSPAYNSGIKEGDLILKVEGIEVKTYNDVLIEINKNESLEKFTFLIKQDNKNKEVVITPVTKEIDGSEVRSFGIAFANKRYYGFSTTIKYSLKEFGNMIKNIIVILANLVTGNISLKNLSGPIGIYTIIDNVKSSFENLIYLTAYLSINVAVINLIPIPVFDGGRILLLVIEKIINKKLNPNVEKYLNLIGFIMLIVLTIYVTLNDIVKIFTTYGG